MRSLYVSFGEHQIAVDLPYRQIRDGFVRNFDALLVSEPSNVCASLEVISRDGAYKVVGDTRLDQGDHSSAGVLKHLKYELLAHLMDARPDLWWLHAGGAVVEGRSVVFAGAWGSGKSTLVTRLCATGARYLSDDVVPIDPTTGHALPFPCTPAVRKPADRMLPRDHVPKLKKVLHRPPRDRNDETSHPIGWVVFPVFTGNVGARLEASGPARAALELTSHVMNRGANAEQALSFCCTLFERVPAYRLTYGDADEAAQLVSAALAGDVEKRAQSPSELS